MAEKEPENLEETQPTTEPAATPPPSEELQQFSKWMAEYGRPALIGLAVAVAVLLGITVWNNQKKEKASAAVQALFQVRSPEELQQLALADPAAPTAPMALASAAAEYYAQNRFDEALEAYRNFLTRYSTNLLAGDVALGVASSLEALENFTEAVSAYEAFAEANPDSPLRPQAVMGAARCHEQLGQFPEARALYEDFIAANPESPWLPQAESGLLFLNQAERARNAPPAAAPATEPAPAASAGESVAPVPPAETSAPAAEETAEVTDQPASAQPETPAAPADSQPKKKKSSKKQPADSSAAPAAPEPVPAPAE